MRHQLNNLLHRIKIMTISTHIKHENIHHAIQALQVHPVEYKIEDGMVFGKPCYWIKFSNKVDMDIVRKLYDYCQTSDD